MSNTSRLAAEGSGKSDEMNAAARKPAMEKIAEAAQAAQDRVVGGIETAKSEALGAARRQKDAGAEKINSVARSVHGVADSVQSELPQMSRSIHNAAAALERASTALRERKVEDLAAGAGDFARRQPMLFFGAAVIAGFAVARFLKSSSQSSNSPDRRP